MPTELVHLVNPAVVSEAIERAAAEAKALELLDSGLWCDVRVLPAEGSKWCVHATYKGNSSTHMISGTLTLL
jgi:hypothetical protein